MRCTLALPEMLWDQMQAWADEELETAGLLLARTISGRGSTTIIGRRLVAAPSDAYLERTATSLALRSSAWVPAMRAAASEGSLALFVHTHPVGPTVFSERDDHVDQELRDAWSRIGGAGPYGSMVISRQAPGVTARLWTSNSEPTPITRLRVVGDRIRIVPLGTGNAQSTEIHSRQLLALGEAGQQVLQSMHVGVVGAGGTGSPTAEQLIRLGIGELTVIDDDVVTPSTLSRGYGSGTQDIGRPKVDVVRDLARDASPDLRVNAIVGNVRDQAVAHRLDQCDVVFCCADGHAARLVLNRMAYWQLIPVLDVAVLVSSKVDSIESIDARVTWIAPGTACLLCRERLDAELAYAEQLDPEERRALTEQGYAPDLDEPEPSVVAYTTLVSSLAVVELLNRLFDIADSAPSELLMRVDRRDLRLNRRSPREGCFCGAPAMWARGLEEPYLDLTWLS